MTCPAHGSSLAIARATVHNLLFHYCLSRVFIRFHQLLHFNYRLKRGCLSFHSRKLLTIKGIISLLPLKNFRYTVPLQPEFLPSPWVSAPKIIVFYSCYQWATGISLYGYTQPNNGRKCSNSCVHNEMHFTNRRNRHDLISSGTNRTKVNQWAIRDPLFTQPGKMRNCTTFLLRHAFTNRTKFYWNLSYHWQNGPLEFPYNKPGTREAGSYFG